MSKRGQRVVSRAAMKEASRYDRLLHRTPLPDRYPSKTKISVRRTLERLHRQPLKNPVIN